MILRFVIADDSRIPAVAETVTVADDGALTGWRSVSDGGVGWFAGRLPEAELPELRALAAESPEPGPAPDDTAQELLTLDGTGPISIAGHPGALATAARHLLDRLTDFPLAAVAVSFVAPDVARLSHRGTEPIQLDLDFLAVRVTAWPESGGPAGDWSGVADGPPDLVAEPGWTYDVPVRIPVAGAAAIGLAVDFGILAGDTRVPVQTRSGPAPAER